MADARAVRIPKFNSLADDMEAAVESFLNYGRAKNLSQNTLGYYGHRLQAFRSFAPDNTPASTTRDLIRAFLAHETQRTSPATAQHSFIALRAFFGFLQREGFLEESPVNGVEGVRRRRAIIDTFTQEQLQAILSTCGKDFTGVRDRAILLTLLDCGLRASELCGLALDDIAWNEQTLLVLGKGDVERIVPFGVTARQALAQYAARRGTLDTKMLFVTWHGDPLDRYRLREVVQERCGQAGVTGVRCSPHTFRHTFAVSYLRNGGDVFSLQKMLGHSDLEMTRRYAELSQMDVRDKHRQFSPADRLQPAPDRHGKKRLK
jgi:integrase/recombinase XerD